MSQPLKRNSGACGSGGECSLWPRAAAAAAAAPAPGHLGSAKQRETSWADSVKVQKLQKATQGTFLYAHVATHEDKFRPSCESFVSNKDKFWK